MSRAEADGGCVGISRGRDELGGLKESVRERDARRAVGPVGVITGC